MGIDLTKGGNGGGSSEDRVVLPTDIYVVECVEAELEDDTFSKPNKDGSLPQKIKTVWEVVRLTAEQQEAADEREQEWVGTRVWHRFNPFYGPVKAGGPSKFKEFIDLAVDSGALTDFEPADFDPPQLVGMKLKASIAQYTKTMGENAGKPGNKITAWAALKPAKKTAPAAQPKQPTPRGRASGDELFEDAAVAAGADTY
jgi:hypothetical protein